MKTKRKIFRRFVPGALVAFAVMVGLVIWSNQVCQKAARGRIFSSIESVPANEVGVVLGTSKLTKAGTVNLHFTQRIEAAAALYRAGKVRHLVVSGDNHVAGYDEPTDMRHALVAAGVPNDAITSDYAGFRTLDSIVRAQTVFGLQRFTVITEEFHCPRAVWIARQHGLEVVAFAAPDVNRAAWSLRAKAREYLARAWCAVDLYALHRGPKFAGPREPIVISASEPV